jgi:hypothetical protein
LVDHADAAAFRLGIGLGAGDTLTMNAIEAMTVRSNTGDFTSSVDIGGGLDVEGIGEFLSLDVDTDITSATATAGYGYFTNVISTTAKATSGTITNLTASNINGYGIIQGDLAQNTVLRKETFDIINGTASTSIKVLGSDGTGHVWNEDVWDTVDNVTKGYTGTYYDLSADGYYLKVHPAVSQGTTFITVLSAELASNSTGVVSNVYETTESGNMIFHLTNASDGSLQDLTTLVDSGNLVIRITYFTDD